MFSLGYLFFILYINYRFWDYVDGGNPQTSREPANKGGICSNVRISKEQ